MKTIKTIDLLTINECAKAVKQNTLIIIGNMMIGLDDIHIYISYICNIELTDDYTNMIFIKKDLSAFIKTISHELEFNIDNNGMIKSLVSEMKINYITRQIEYDITNYINILNSYYSIQPIYNITDDLQDLFSMKKTDGMFKYIYQENNKKYFMTLYPGLLPVNKNDKIFVSIISEAGNIFTVKFSIQKKKSMVVNMIISFLNLV